MRVHKSVRLMAACSILLTALAAAGQVTSIRSLYGFNICHRCRHRLLSARLDCPAQWPHIHWLREWSGQGRFRRQEQHDC